MTLVTLQRSPNSLVIVCPKRVLLAFRLRNFGLSSDVKEMVTEAQSEEEKANEAVTFSMVLIFLIPLELRNTFACNLWAFHQNSLRNFSH